VKASGLDVEVLAGLGGSDGGRECLRVVEKLEDGSAGLTLGVEGFGGEGRGDRGAQGGGRELGLDEARLDGRDHGGIIGQKDARDEIKDAATR
jgi:hypothetical protein